MKKTSVMLVDDEKLALDELLNLVKWYELGFEIVAQAFNGKQAFAKYQLLKPQLIFTDIKMPISDGISLISNIRKISDNTTIFILSAYEDFTYAKTAFKFGVTNYLIKSEINEINFAQLLLKIRNKISMQETNARIIVNKMLADYFLKGDILNINSLKVLSKQKLLYVFINKKTPVEISNENITSSTFIQLSSTARYVCFAS